MKEMPKIGYRNIKTCIAVFICIIVFNFLNRDNYTLACVATVLCMGDTLGGSVKTSWNRLSGIIIGGLSSIIFLYLLDFISSIHINTPIVIAIGISFIIYMCNLFKATDSCSVACIIYISIMFGYSGSGAFTYVLNNGLDTFIGVIVAIIVNSLIKPPTPREEIVTELNELITLTITGEEPKEEKTEVEILEEDTIEKLNNNENK